MDKNERFTLTCDRFQVSCSYCGLLTQFATKTKAFEYANRVKFKHTAPDESIEVFDCMAHKGNQNLWGVT